MKIYSELHEEYFVDTNDLSSFLQSLSLKINNMYCPISEDNVDNDCFSVSSYVNETKDNDYEILFCLSCNKTNKQYLDGYYSVPIQNFINELYNIVESGKSIDECVNNLDIYNNLRLDFCSKNHIVIFNAKYDCQGYICNKDKYLVGTFNSLAIFLNDKFCPIENAPIKSHKTSILSNTMSETTVELMEVFWLSESKLDEELILYFNIPNLGTYQMTWIPGGNPKSNHIFKIIQIPFQLYERRNIYEFNEFELDEYIENHRKFIIEQNSNNSTKKDNNIFEFLL